MSKDSDKNIVEEENVEDIEIIEDDTKKTAADDEVKSKDDIIGEANTRAKNKYKGLVIIIGIAAFILGICITIGCAKSNAKKKPYKKALDSYVEVLNWQAGKEGFYSYKILHSDLMTRSELEEYEALVDRVYDVDANKGYVAYVKLSTDDPDVCERKLIHILRVGNKYVIADKDILKLMKTVSR